MSVFHDVVLLESRKQKVCQGCTQELSGQEEMEQWERTQIPET